MGIETCQYNPDNHFWHVSGDTLNVWSSAERAYMPVDDDRFVAWKNTHMCVPTKISSEDDLRGALVLAGCGDRSPGYVPARVHLWQFRAALEDAGLLSAFQEAIAASMSVKFRTAWEYAGAVTRDGDMVVSISEAIGLTKAQVDEVFLSAAAHSL